MYKAKEGKARKLKLHFTPGSSINIGTVISFMIEADEYGRHIRYNALRITKAGCVDESSFDADRFIGYTLEEEITL